MRTCDSDDLERFEAGTLPPHRAAQVAAHVAACEGCRAELEWLSVEKKLMAHRSEPARPADDLWKGVERRLQAPARRRIGWAARVWRVAGSWQLPVALAGAATLALLVHSGATQAPPPPPPETDRVNAALDGAERDYARAAAELEQRYHAERGRLSAATALRFDRAFDETRRRVDEARVLARGDREARMAALDGYAAYVRSLHSVLADLEGAP